VVCLNAAVEDGLIASSPAVRVPRLPPAHIEREYLRLEEIPRYLDGCCAPFSPLAETLIGSGTRISEALALRVGDVELEDAGGVIVIYRSRKKDAIGSTKSNRFRSVEIGPTLAAVLRAQLARGGERAGAERKDAYVFVMPVRTARRARMLAHGAAAPDHSPRAVTIVDITLPPALHVNV
jgi:integrase